MQAHYARVNGAAQAGAVTYFAFLSFFPLLALGFFVVGYIAKVYAQARDDLVKAINDALPGLIAVVQSDGTLSSGISLESIERAATTVGIIGLVGLIYSGLGWLSAMRSALHVVFEMPRSQRPNFVIGKLRDLLTLAVIGATLLVSVAVTGVVVGYSTKILDLVDAGHGLAWLVKLVGFAVGIATSMVLFYALFRLLARPRTPRRALWQGALLGGLGFEALKLASSFLLSLTQNQPAFQAFGIALVLLVWINYFSKIVMYAAAWAHTSRPARAAQAVRAAALPAEPLAAEPLPAVPPPAPVATPDVASAGRTGPDPRLAFGAGAATALGLVALVRRVRR
jgi:membrane protein